MSEENKAIVRRVIDELFNNGNLAAADDLIASDVVDHDAPPGLPPGREGMKQFVAMYRNAFPDLQSTVDDQIAEGDKILNRWSSKSTHSGVFGGSCDW